MSDFILISSKGAYGKDELYSANDLEDIRDFIDMKIGDGVAADGRGGDDDGG